MQRLQAEVRALKEENQAMQHSLQQARTAAGLTASEATANANRQIMELEQQQEQQRQKHQQALEQLRHSADADSAQLRRRHAEELQAADEAVRAAREAATRAGDSARHDAERAAAAELERQRGRWEMELKEKESRFQAELEAQRSLREQEIAGLLGARENTKSLQELLQRVCCSHRRLPVFMILRPSSFHRWCQQSLPTTLPYLTPLRRLRPMAPGRSFSRHLTSPRSSFIIAPEHSLFIRLHTHTHTFAVEMPAQVKMSAQDVTALQSQLGSKQEQQLADRELRVTQREQALTAGESSLAKRRHALDEQSAQLQELHAKLEVSAKLSQAYVVLEPGLCLG